MKSIHTKFCLAMVCLFAMSLPGACASRNISANYGNMSRSNREVPADFSASGDNAMNTDAQTHKSDSRAIGVRRSKWLPSAKTVESRFALVIGNSGYKNIPPLANPGNDALDMKNTLETLGFQVTYLQNARDRREMTEAVRQLGLNLMHNKNAVGLFFYAGHAMQIKGVNYLIPTDAVIKGEADVEFETLNVNYLLQTMDYSQNGMNIIIMDACRNNPYARGFRSVADRGLAPMDSPTGSIIVFATAPGKTAADGTGRNGMFTKHLLEHIDKPDLTIEQMLKRVRIGVIDETDGSQTPWETSSLRGDFCFGGCRDKSVLQSEARKKIESELREKMQTEQQRLADERAQLEAMRNEIEAKKLEMKIKANEAQQRRDRETLENIRKEQTALSEQKLLIKLQQDSIEQQEAVLTNEKTSRSQKENELAKLKEERENFEKERADLERLRIETEKARRQIEEARTPPETNRREEGRYQPSTSAIGVGF